MEISREIILKIFDSLNEDSYNDSLDNLLIQLNANKVEDILHAEECEVVRSLDSKIHTLISSELVRLNSVANSSVEAFAGLVSGTNRYLKLAIKDGNLKALLTFLSAHCYLQIGLAEFLNRQLISDETKLPLTKQIVHLLKSFKFEAKLLEDASYYEKELKKTSENGLEEENIEKIYDLILAVERGGRGFHFNFLLEHLYNFLFQYNQDEFSKLINSSSHPETNVFYLQAFKKCDLIILAENQFISDKWTLFELMRQIIDEERKEDVIRDEDRKAVIRCLTKLHLADNKIYRQAISFFHRSKLFNSSLGEQTASLELDQVIDIFKNLFPIDKYDFNFDARNLFLQQYSNAATEENSVVLLKTVFERWKDLYNEIYNSDEYQSDLLLTDYSNYLVHYFALVMDEETLIKLITENANNLQYIDSEWFKDASQQITHFNLYLTKLYILSYGFRNKELHSEELSLVISKLNSITILKKRFKQLKDLNAFQKIEENISWKEVP